jgi:hypothetical protein
MRIGNRDGEAPPPPEDRPEWHVRVCVSVAEHVPAPILRAWIIVESFARDQSSCWPGNKILSARFGVKIRACQYVVENLEDHGIVERRPMPGNRRSIFLIRRTWQPITSHEWNSLADRAARRAAGRAALAAQKKVERKAHRPKIRIVG